MTHIAESPGPRRSVVKPAVHPVLRLGYEKAHRLIALTCAKLTRPEALFWRSNNSRRCGPQNAAESGTFHVPRRAAGSGMAQAVASRSVCGWSCLAPRLWLQASAGRCEAARLARTWPRSRQARSQRSDPARSAPVVTGQWDRTYGAVYACRLMRSARSPHRSAASRGEDQSTAPLSLHRLHPIVFY